MVCACVWGGGGGRGGVINGPPLRGRRMVASSMMSCTALARVSERER